MEVLILIVHVLTACAIIAFVLLQHGKGADMGAAFGGGSAGSLFGAAGSANFLSRTTGILAAVFFVTSVGLTWLASHRTTTHSVMQHAVPTAPAAPPAKSEAVPNQQPVAPVNPGTPAAPAPAKDAGSKAKEVPN